MTFLLNLITAAVLYGTPLLYGTAGEILTEKSGNLNLGVEGMMFMGGAMGLGAAFYYEKLAGAAVSPPLAVVIAIAGSFLAGVLGALIFSFLTITLRANQNVTGLALTIFGTGNHWSYPSSIKSGCCFLCKTLIRIILNPPCFLLR